MKISLPQKNIKILLLISFLIILIIFISLAASHYSKKKDLKTSSVPTTIYSDTLSNYYRECVGFLGTPQTLSDGRIVKPPQIICKVINNKVNLIPIDQVEIEPGDFVIEVVNASKLFTKEYFDSKNQKLPQNQKLTFSPENETFCVSYGPYVSSTPLVVMPNFYFQSSLIYTDSAISCRTIPLRNLFPIGVMGKISQDMSGKPFGLSILIPNNPQDPYHSTFITLYSAFIKIK